MSRKKPRHKIVGNDGDPCPRCGRPTQIREHIEIRPKQLAQPYYYSRWFYCAHTACETNQIMPPRYQVFQTPTPEAQDPSIRDRLNAIDQQLTPPGGPPPWL